MPDLTPKQRRFVDEYLIDSNATQAALRAGYSPKSSRDIGQQLLNKTHIAPVIEARQRAIAAQKGISAERVLQELAVIGFSNIEHYRLNDAYHLTLTADAPEHAMRAIASVKHRIRTIPHDEGETELQHDIEYRLWDKNVALTNLGKYLKLFIERHEVSGPDGGPLPVQVYLPQKGSV